MKRTSIPDSCTFADPLLFITKKGEGVYRDLCTKADNRDQDAHGLYIYNDFTNYGLLDLIDKMLSSIHHKIVKRDIDEAYSLFEGLVAFAVHPWLGYGWGQVDDGEHVEITNKALGTLLMNVIRTLKKEGRLDLEHFPSLLTFLKNVVELGNEMADSFEDMGRYDNVCKAVAFRLMDGREREQEKLDKARLNEWLASFRSNDRRDIRQALKEREEEEGAGDKNWWKDGETYDEDDKHPDFSMTRVWKEYKDFLAGWESLPFWGPPEWDLTKWSEKEKKDFKLGDSP